GVNSYLKSFLLKKKAKQIAELIFSIQKDTENTVQMMEQATQNVKSGISISHKKQSRNSI
ncbi:hypothetical protein ABEV12_12825, partial [Geobacillus stearothermophilus]